MAAFQDPAGPNYPYQSPTSGSRGGSPSPTAALATGSSTLSVPSIEDEKESLSDKASAHRSVHLGYPAPYLFNDDKSSKHFGDEERREASRAKAAAYAEAFGLQDQEAWEDYGRSHYAKEPPRESVYHLPKSPASRVGLSAAAESSSSLSPSRQIRAERTASVWDMEATLKAGVPVASGESICILRCSAPSAKPPNDAMQQHLHQYHPSLQLTPTAATARLQAAAVLPSDPNPYCAWDAAKTKIRPRHRPVGPMQPRSLILSSQPQRSFKTTAAPSLRRPIFPAIGSKKSMRLCRAFLLPLNKPLSKAPRPNQREARALATAADLVLKLLLPSVPLLTTSCSPTMTPPASPSP